MGKRHGLLQQQQKHHNAQISTKIDTGKVRTSDRMLALLTTTVSD